MSCKEIKEGSEKDDILFKIEYGLTYELGMSKYKQISNDIHLTFKQRRDQMSRVYENTTRSLNEIMKRYGKTI